MLRKLSCSGLVLLLACFLCETSVFAKAGSDPSEPPAKTAPVAKNDAANEKLRRDVLKLVTDTKAAKPAPHAPSPFQRTKRNNLSTGAKIGIVAAIVGAIVVIVILQKLNSD